MAHEHSVVDTDTHFAIDSITHVISSTSKKTVLIQKDHDSTVITFELPRWIDGHDMSMCNMVEIHYINTDYKDKTVSRAGVYLSTDLNIADDVNKVTCSWKISQNATQYVGPLSFIVSFQCADDSGNVTYRWNTATYSKISVSAGIDNGDAVAADFPDILAQWQAEVEKVTSCAVLTTEQSLTTSQQKQARDNIGALGKNANNDLDMSGYNIHGVGAIAFPGEYPDEYVSVTTENAEQGKPALVFHGYDGCEPPVLRNISGGITDTDAVTLGQLKDYTQDMQRHGNDIRDLQEAAVIPSN